MINAFRIQLLKAKTGDSFIVECGDNTFFIDGGTRSVAKYLKRYLQENDPTKLQAVFVTHVDRDHIGGIAKLYSQFGKYVPKTAPVYMNHPEQVKVNTNTSGLVTFEDGNNLKDVLAANGYKLEEATTGKVLRFGETRIDILSPQNVVAGQLFKEWEESDDDGLVSSDIIEVDCSTLPSEPQNSILNDIVNASSISFTVTYKGRSALFLSDTLPEIVTNQLSEKTNFDVVKISHHGSKHNTSMELLHKIDCNNFIISTNGPRSYGHPHAESLARLILSSIEHGYSECNITFNYEKVRDRIKINNLPKGFRVNLIYSESIIL
ncbi:ComEC/Rec2 family competence protein [Photobacterium sanguinicancri]|uniref:MBL fold metallo-hydrolase n=1 Tax=Photobacterium sanguinicancri TaxID=875932 RepID=A0ABX4FTW8_9GAMM|nr:MBL fold metallo-hydrolase [Photobacterium sanguinicancri]OZS42196.1 MBL fold metallo-hydrolase [Photobacterium sanguinicancri]